MKLGELVILVLVILLAVGAGTAFIFADLFWFTGLGYADVYLTMLLTSTGFGLLLGVGFFIFASLNIKLAKRMSFSKAERKKAKDMPFILLALFLATIIGSSYANWEILLKFLNASTFAAIDPVFGMNIGFYVFTLPFYQLIFSFLATTVGLTMFLSFLFYLIHSDVLKKKEVANVVEMETDEHPAIGIEFSPNFSKIKKLITPHMSMLLAALFFIAAFGFHLAQYGLLFNSGNVFYGAGFADLNVSLLFLNVGFYVSIVIGIAFILNLKIRRWRLLMEGVGILVAIVFVGLLAAGAVQVLYVGPNEYNVQKPYIEMNIESTTAAYGLDSIENRIFPVSYDLTIDDVNQNIETIGNIRLWDWRPLRDTYTQLQLFRTYYDFSDIDIDRYKLNGKYKQVMLSPREMDINDLSSTAQTWVNKHLVYTHGYGVVMNPVDKVSEEGLPEFYIKDIPPKSDYEVLNIDRPEIYYGESTSQYVITKTTTQEFDYPSGDQNIYMSYEGTGGIPIGDFFKKLVYAIRFASIELLVSGSVTEDSRILLNRNIDERTMTIAPFLKYDYDPYIVISDGRLYWILDAYTTTDMYPYSEPVYSERLGMLNYMRNSVKVVTDAYNGDVTYYVVDSSDPLIQTYMKIFPDMFKDFSEMPAGIKDHVRYPEDIFTVQATLYSTYHMEDPQVFYNKEDVWVIPNEVYISGTRSMIPYYVIIKLPDAQDEDFMLMIPFKPRGEDKQNMIGWMSANSDPDDYGKIVVYQFSKQELVYGPMQIEAMIDQDTEISQLITLWSQSGSNVIRGNTLVIPIKNSILYIEPLYLQATQEGSLPQLKRVIVAYKDSIAMEETLSEAIAKIFGIETTRPTVPATPGEDETAEELLERISQLYEQAQAALQAGDFTAYAEYIEQIGALLEYF
ncbi:MAG: UPF0182 family protein [Nanoarchaeota archaeon]